jgi:hypothetical protein
MYNWPLNDAQLVPLVLSCLAVIAVGSIVSALTRVRRTEFARLQKEVKQLSEEIKALQVAEQRRLLMELNRTAKVKKASASKAAATQA